MLLKFFKGTGPGVIFMITILFMVLWAGTFIHPEVLSDVSAESAGMPLFNLLVSIFTPGHLPALFLSAALSVVMLFLLINFNTTIFFINERTFLPALLFIMFVGLFPEYQKLNPVLPASVMFMIALKRIMAGYHKQGIAYNFFDAGILISTGSLFYANLIWFGIIILIGIILLRTVSVSEIAVMLLGLITPYLVTFGLYYVVGYDLKVLLEIISGNLFTRSEVYNFSRPVIVTLILFAVILVISTGYLLMLQNSKKIKSRKTFSLLIWIFFISVAVYFLVPSASVEVIWITAIPASYILSHFYINSRNKIVSEILFTTVFLMILVIQGLYLFGV